MLQLGSYSSPFQSKLQFPQPRSPLVNTTCIQSSLVKTRQFCDWLLIERDGLTSQDRSTLSTSQPLVNTICISFQLCQLQTGLNFGILLLNCYFRLYVHWRWACFARNASVRNKSMKKAVWLASWLLRSLFQSKLQYISINNMFHNCSWKNIANVMFYNF